MNKRDKTLEDLKNEARESFMDSLSYEGFNSWDDLESFEPHDMIFEITDSCVPIYTYDLLAVAQSNLWLATYEPEMGPAFDGSPTPTNIIAANIFEAIEQDLFEFWDEIPDGRYVYGIESDSLAGLFREGSIDPEYAEEVLPELLGLFDKALESDRQGRGWVTYEHAFDMIKLAFGE